MESDECRFLVSKVREDIWVDKVNEARLQGNALCKWASTFHPDRSGCKLEGGFLNGSYNVSQKIVFEDSCQWMIRFPRVSTIHDDYADEKVRIEVETMSIIGERTTIPVPKVHAWGIASDNPLHLGPFIMMDYICGESLHSILTPPHTRLIREDINNNNIEYIYKQIANIFLQIFSLDFNHISSLLPIKTGGTVPVRPLT
ncbi:uncharacterized protein TRUGW13939_05436 [Talaromyces rugulosus]|uniref:Aminoglycoside phosphotransferase domain-containing protein n=1 Tax=Talaromyces rugulosus TaxID=121627 RepID=A0A7H8QW74_TALRU|nr:uncharacterized protein TRUGW13939_05436 [Talaromyces rugulosus]QKX58314.1 hypothetical protein TRUGW13939_05436 [Talaromyces rugulosus]